MTDWFIENMFRFCIHEFGHYLQGGNNEHIGFGFWGMCSGWGIKNFVANSFERYRLGWINLNTISNTPNQTIQNATLPDFVTSGVAYRLEIDPASNQYFYLENHQKNSYWESTQFYSLIENGVYVLRQDGSYGGSVQAIPADGRYNWIVNQLTPNPWVSRELPVYKRLVANRVDGYHDLQSIPYTWNGLQFSDVIHYTEDSKTGAIILDVRYAGDGKDAFRLGYNELFSPYSNPNSQRASKTSTPFGFKLNSLNNGVYAFDIFVNTSLNAPPSKPTGFTVSVVNNQAQLNWDANIEPDMKWSGKYKIYRTSTTGGEPTNFGYITTINAYSTKVPVTSWTDPDPFVGTGTDKLFYRITALDNGNLESVPSDYDWVYWDQGMQKQGHSGAEQITEYKIFDNYPNPFNPVTVINFQIPKSGRVMLKVYDILGKEITTLVNEEKETGRYSVNFDASNLSSGVYLYELVANDYRAVKKLMVIK